jgi:sugar O-acyltransferase (sialic acid O-acetyltransferase NeuD family)
VILFGVRSPIAVEVEESCSRCGIRIEAAISVNEQSRIVDQSRVMTLAQLSSSKLSGKFMVCAFAPRRRRELVEMARTFGLELAAALIDPHAVLARTVRVGGGSFINAGVIVGAVSMIGENVLINRAASVGHHTVLDDFVSIGPGATLAGHIRVGAGTVIGAGSTVLPNIKIGANSLIGAGSLVREDVPDDTFVVGNPAKPRAFDPTKSSLYVEGSE